MSLYEKSIAEDRKAWRDEQLERCMLNALTHYGPLEIHEIAKRSFAPKKWWSRLNCLLVCQSCHREIEDNRAAWPLARQLARKAVRDPTNFDLRAWLELYYPNAPQRVTWAEVAAFLEVRG